MPKELDVEPRKEKGKKAVKKLRASGKIPAILYGHTFDSLPLTIDERSLKAILRSEGGLHGLFELKIEGIEDGEHTVVFKEVQLDPIKDHVLHVDFQKIRKGEELTADVSLHFVGDPVGVKAGGILQHYLREVTVQCLPKDLPDHIEVDISHLDIKDNLRVSDLVTLEGVKYVNSPEEMVAAVAPKRVRDVASLIAEEELTEEKLAELVELGEITAEQAAEVAEEREFGVAEAEVAEAEPEEAAEAAPEAEEPAE